MDKKLEFMNLDMKGVNQKNKIYLDMGGDRFPYINMRTYPLYQSKFIYFTVTTALLEIFPEMSLAYTSTLAPLAKRALRTAE